MIDHQQAQSPVRHQGQRRTCTGFAVCAGHEWISDAPEIRSPEDAIWAAHQMPGTGSGEAVSVQAALGGLTSHDHASEVAWPYGNPNWSSGRPAAALLDASRRALPTWRRLGDTRLEQIRPEVAVGNAVVLTVGVVSAAWQESSGVIDAPVGRRRRTDTRYS